METDAMINELERLRDNPQLQLLLGYYAEAGVTAPGEWLDRVMALPGVEVRHMSRLHGQLIAHDWLEHEADRTAIASVAVSRARYRVTEAGLQASKLVLVGQTENDDVLMGIAARTAAKKVIRAARSARRRKRSS